MKKKTAGAAKTAAGRRKPVAKKAASLPEHVEEPAVAYVAVAPARTKTFRVGGSQAVRLPKAFRLPDGEVLVEKRGDEIVLKTAPKEKVWTDSELRKWLRALHEKYGKPTEEWPDIERPGPETNRPMGELEW